jgi:hypothetical protein
MVAASSDAIPLQHQCLSSIEAPLMVRITMLNSLLQDDVSNNAEQLVTR